MRELFFYIVLVGGGLALLGLYWPRRSGETKRSTTPAQPQNLVEQLLHKDSVSGEERRIWLDRFLQEQQEEEKK